MSSSRDGRGWQGTLQAWASAGSPNVSSWPRPRENVVSRKSVGQTSQLCLFESALWRGGLVELPFSAVQCRSIPEGVKFSAFPHDLGAGYGLGDKATDACGTGQISMAMADQSQRLPYEKARQMAGFLLIDRVACQPSSSAPTCCMRPKLLTKGPAMRGSFTMAL